MPCVRTAVLVSVVLAVVAPSLFAAEVDGRIVALDGTPALSKPITLTMRAAALKEVLAKIQELTGAQLRPSRDVAEDKATIRVKDRPAREVLGELAKCFDLCWSSKDQDGKPYLYLWMDRRSLQNMEQRTYEDYVAIFQQFDSQMQTTATYVQSGERYQIGEAERQSMSRDDLDRAGLREQATTSIEMAAAVLQYLKLTSQQRKDLLSGQHVNVPTASISPDALEKWPDAKSFDYWVDASLGGYLLKCGRRPDNGITRLLATAVFDDARYDKIINAANEAIKKDQSLDKDLPTPKAAASSTDSTAATAQPTTDPRPVGQPLLDAKWYANPNPGEGSAALPATMSDGLLEVAEALDLQFVAQYVSEYNGLVLNGYMHAAAPSKAKKAAERIAELSLLHKFTVERDGECLLAKSMVWHRLRSREIPEASIKKWQREITGLNEPTFGVASEMAALGWGQLRGAMNNQEPWFGYMNLTQLAQAEYGIRLYGSLNAEQRKLADSAQEVPCASMSKSQLLAFMQGFELREQPTYEQATDPNWVADASFSIEVMPDEFLLIAVSGMRRLGSVEVILQIPQNPDGSTDQNMTREQRQAQQQAQADEAAKKLLAAVCAKHPEIKPSAIGIYGSQVIDFKFKLAKQTRIQTMTYSVKR